MKTCSACGADNKDNAKFCAKCGGSIKDRAATENLAPSLASCPQCRTEHKPSAKFCPGCGFNLTQTPAAAPVVEITAARPPDEVPVTFSEPSQPAVHTLSSLSPEQCQQSSQSVLPPDVQEHSLPFDRQSVQPVPGRGKSLAIGIGLASLFFVGGAGYWYFVQNSDSKMTEQPIKVTDQNLPPVTSPPSPLPPEPTVSVQPIAQPQQSPPAAAPAPEPQLQPPPVATPEPVKKAEPQSAEVTQEPSTKVSNGKPSEKPATRPKSKESKEIPITSTPKPTPTPGAAPPQFQTTILEEILSDGEKCLFSKRYDCAISSANNALRLDSSSLRARHLKQSAEAAQKKALDSISIQ